MKARATGQQPRVGHQAAGAGGARSAAGAISLILPWILLARPGSSSGCTPPRAAMRLADQHGSGRQRSRAHLMCSEWLSCALGLGCARTPGVKQVACFVASCSHGSCCDSSSFRMMSRHLPGSACTVASSQARSQQRVEAVCAQATTIMPCKPNPGPGAAERQPHLLGISMAGEVLCQGPQLDAGVRPSRDHCPARNGAAPDAAPRMPSQHGQAPPRAQVP